MYRLKEIQDKLLHVVGWEQSFDPSQEIKQELTESESGLYFQNAHPLVTLKNIESTMPEQFIIKYPAWNMIIQYKSGAKVRHNNIVYLAMADNVNIEPRSSDFNEDFNDDFGAVWVKYNFISDWLEKETRAGISSVIQNFIKIKQIDKQTRDIMEFRTFFDGSGRIANTIDNKGKIVGFEIVPVKGMGVTTKVERIGLQMTGGIGNVRVYIFHSSLVNPYRVLNLNYTLANGGFQWFKTPDLYLPYISDDTNAGGTWFMCYNQNDLPEDMEAINVSKDWSRDPCGGCNIGNVQNWRELTQYVGISPFSYQAPLDFEEFPELWDTSKNIYTSTMSYGMNVEVTVGCDLTDFIVTQRRAFASVIQKQVAVNLLKLMALNPETRVNRYQVNVTRGDILYEVDGNTSGPRPGGLGYDLYKTYEALNIDTGGIDRLCLSCTNKGVRYKVQ